MLTDLDEALERLQQTDFEYGDGLSNDGALAVAALEALGHPALIPFFIDVYTPRLGPLVPGTPIPEDERARALGDRARRADWLATFERALGDAEAEALLGVWLPVLLPGAFAAAGSGLLRTASALRMQGQGGGENDVRRRELAFGLAHWASRFQVLPGEPGTRPVAGRGIVDALARLQGLASDRRHVGPPSEAVLVLEGDAGFAAEVAAIDLDALPVTEALVGLVRRVAALQLAHPESRAAYGRVIETAMALHSIAGHLPAARRSEAVGRAAQIALAVHGVYGAGAGAGAPGQDVERAQLARDVDELRYRAACSGQESAITLAEACLRAHALQPDPLLLEAAADAALRIDAGHGGRGG